MTGNKLAHKIKKVSRNLPQNSSGTVKNETENITLDREITKERCISPKKTANYWWPKINKII